MHAFIIRPFGTKNGIDFDRVEKELIRPALEKLKLSGGTTGEFIQQGNIRTDMFEQLLIADLVVADISIHNANAFYELGIRHAFRDKRTFPSVRMRISLSSWSACMISSPGANVRRGGWLSTRSISSIRARSTASSERERSEMKVAAASSVM